MINISKLKAEARKRKKFKKECFRKILEMCLNKIEIVSKTGVTKSWFEIPVFLLGYPTYKMSECSKYIIKKLKNDGFKTNFIDPNLILIDWSFVVDSD